MKIKTTILAVTLALLTISVTAQSGKFGHVNSQYIVQLMPEYDSISKVIFSLDSMYNIELERLQVEINVKIEEYSNDIALPELVKEAKATEIQELQILQIISI